MSGLSWARRLSLSLKTIAPGGGRRLAGKDRDGNLYFEKPDPNGGRYPRRTVELADPQLSEANYDDANIAVQWQAWLRNTRRDPPTTDEIQRDEARKQLTMTRAKVLDQAWQDRKVELALEKAQEHKTILSIASQSLAGAKDTTGASTSSATTDPSPTAEAQENEPKSAARKQIEEREAARKAGFKPSVQQGDTFQPEAWSPTAARRR